MVTTEDDDDVVDPALTTLLDTDPSFPVALQTGDLTRDGPIEDSGKLLGANRCT